MRLRPSSDSSLAEVLEHIHGVPTKDTSWADALEKVCDFVGARAADLSFLEPTTGTFSRIVPVRLDSDGLSRYGTQYAQDPLHTNPRLPSMLSRKEADCWADSDVWTPRERGRLQFFGELVHPYFGVYDALNTWIRKSSDGRVWVPLLLHYGKHDGAPSAEARRRFRLLIPHLRRACNAEEMLQSAQVENAVLGEALDHVSQAIALIGSSGRVIRANSAAARMLSASNGISLGLDQRLLFAANDAREAFGLALSRCTSPIVLISGYERADPAQVVLHRRSGAPVIITLQPLARHRAGESGALAVMFISDPDATPMDRTTLLRNIYGLSPAENRLVHGLAAGRSLKTIAERSNITYETARSHLRRALTKMGAQRQSEIVKIFQQLG